MSMSESTLLQPATTYSKLESAVSAKDVTPPLWLSYVKLTRIHKFPHGIILVVWPCMWGLAMSAYSAKLSLTSWVIQSVAYLVGSVLRHNASCIWGDMCDIEYDRKVERCKGRPLARGLVSMTGAAIFLFIHFVLCVLIMLPAGKSAFIVGCIGLFGVDMIYPFTKRWTNWPQFILGIAMTWGLPVAWISNTGSIDWNMIPVLFLGGMCWTIYYDTIYACQDRRDDVKAGVKSTAVLFGDAVRPILACFATAFVFCLAYAGVLNGNGLVYFVITVAGAAVHFVWQLMSVNFDVGADCWRIFKSNGDLGYIMFAGMICDYALRIAH